MFKKIESRLARSLADHPKKYLFISIVILLIFIPGLKNLGTDYSYRIWFEENEQMILDYDKFQEKFGNDDQINIFVHNDEGIFTKDSVELIHKITRDLWLVKDVTRVDSITNYQWTQADDQGDINISNFIPEDYEVSQLDDKKQKALSNEILPNFLISPDGKTASIIGKIRPYIKVAPDDAEIIKQTRKLLSTVDYDKSKITLYINGSLAMNNTFREVAQEDTTAIFPFVILAVLLFLYLSLRNIKLVSMAFTIIVLSLIATLACAGYLGYKFNNLTAMVPIIIMAIAIADSVHILVTYIQFSRLHYSRDKSIYETYLKNIRPTFLTSISTAIGFLSLSNTHLLPLAQLGILSAIGTMIAWFFTITLLSSMLVLVKVDIKDQPETDKIKAKLIAKKVVSFLNIHAKKIVLITFILTIVAIRLAMTNVVDSNAYKYFSDTVALKISNDFALKNIGGYYGPQLSLSAGVADGIKDPIFLAKVEKLKDWLESHESVDKVVSILDVIKSMNRSFHEDRSEYFKIPETKKAVSELLFLYTMNLPQGMGLNEQVSLNNDEIRMFVFWQIQNSKDSLAKMNRIEVKMRELGLDGKIDGKLQIYDRMTAFIIDSFLKSMTQALIGITLLLIIMFRSIKLGLFSMIPNIVPIAFGLAIMKLLGKPIDIGAALVSAVCLGIIVDDTIHFLNNYYKYKKEGRSTVESIETVMANTGLALIWTTVILTFGFGVMMFANFIPNVNFGFLTSIILIIALISDLIILPCFLLLTDRDKNV